MINKENKKDKIKEKWKIKKKIFITFAVVLIVCIIAPLTINFIVLGAGAGSIVAEEKARTIKADCIIVLGALAYDDGTLSPKLKDRVEMGISLYQNGATKKIIMSGDHLKKDYDEVNPMKNYAVRKGVPAEDIFMDHTGLSTYESIYRAKDIFMCKKVIIVTQAFHLSRAIYIAKALGLEAYGVASNQTEYGLYTDLHNNSREFLARNKAFLDCITKPKPTVLGEPISITGNGAATDDK